MNTPDRYDKIRKKLRPKFRWYQFSALALLLLVMTLATMAFVAWYQYWFQYTQYGAQQRSKKSFHRLSLTTAETVSLPASPSSRPCPPTASS